MSLRITPFWVEYHFANELFVAQFPLSSCISRRATNYRRHKLSITLRSQGLSLIVTSLTEGNAMVSWSLGGGLPGPLPRALDAPTPLGQRGSTVVGLGSCIDSTWAEGSTASKPIVHAFLSRHKTPPSTKGNCIKQRIGLALFSAYPHKRTMLSRT